MKLNYYAYHIQDKNTGRKFSNQLDTFLRMFALYSNSDLKNSLVIKGKNHYLLNPVANLFLFLQTNNADLIKKINRQNITADDIGSLLNSDESIAFASYIYFTQSCFGMASPSSSPKLQSFCMFINNLLDKTGNSDYEIVARPLLLEELSKDEALNLDVMGKAVIEVGTENNFAQHILAFLGMRTLSDYIDLGSIQIGFKPQRGRNIKPIISEAINKISDENLQKFIIAAKNDASESLTQYYIEGKGIIHDLIELDNNDVLAQNIRDKMESNTNLIQRLGVENEDIPNQEVAGINDFNQLTAWSHRFGSVQPSD